MHTLELNRRQTAGREPRFDDVPTIKGYLGNLTSLAHGLDALLISKIPGDRTNKQRTGFVATAALEAWGKGSNYTPEVFWESVTRGLTDFHLAAGQDVDLSGELNQWFVNVAAQFRRDNTPAYAAKFITEGEIKLLDQLKLPEEQPRALTDSIRHSIAAMYKSLVLSDDLAGGWKQKRVDYIEQIRTSGADSGFIQDVLADFTDEEIGVASPHAAHMLHQGRHIFEIELERFTTSDEFKAQRPQHKTKLLQEANTHIINSYKSAETDADPRVASALQAAYGQIATGIVDDAYITYKIRTLSQGYTPQPATTGELEAMGVVQLVNTPKPLSEAEKRTEYVALGLNDELNALLSMLGDHIMGTGGLLALKEDEAKGIQSIAETITQQYHMYLSYIEKSGQPILKSIFIEKARENILVALENSAYPELGELYADLVKNVGEEGKSKLYERKFSKIEESEIDKVAKSIVEDLSAKLLNPVYGVQGVQSLVEVFMLETDDLVKYVNGLNNPQLGTAIAHAAEELLQTISKSGTTAQQAEGLHKVYTKLEEGFRTSVAIDAVQALCKETTQEDIDTEMETMRVQGALPENIDNEFLLTVRETVENRAANTFWIDVVDKVTDPIFGANGSKTDVVKKQMELIAQVEKEFASKSPEYQRRYIKEGLNVMLNSFNDLRDSGNHAAIGALQTMIHNLVREDVSGEADNMEISPLIGGKAALLISWMEKPEELAEMFNKLDHEVYGFGSVYSVYNDLKGLLVDFIDRSATFAIENKPTGSSSGRLQYDVFKLLEDNIITSIRTVTDTGLQEELSKLYTTATEKLGNGAMLYLSQGKYHQEADAIIQNPDIDDATRIEMEMRLQREIPTVNDLLNLKGDEKIEYENVLSDVVNGELQGLWGEYWENYYDIVYGKDTSQGRPGSLVEQAQKNAKSFQEALSHADSSLVCSFLDSAVAVGFERFKQEKDQDKQKRIGFGLFELLGHSKSILVQSLKARENGEQGEFGAKSVRTLGSVQVAFIRKMIADPELMKIAFQYIETKPKKGERKDADELSLCTVVLMTARDAAFKRTGKVLFTEESLTSIIKGKAPNKAVLKNIENALVASVESATNNLEGENPELNVIFELLAAIDTFSPSVLTRLGFAADDLRNLKDTRKQNSLEVKKAVSAIEEAGLSPEETFSKIYTATGKHYFGNDFAPHFSEEIKEIIQSGIIPEGEKNNLLNKVLMYRDDICQVVKTPPGLQLFFGKDWENSAVPHLRSIFDKYLAGFDRRLHDSKIVNPAAKKFVATELLGISMIFENFAGDSPEAKKGPHLQFINILSNIIIDGMNPTGQRVYSEDLHKMADHILRESVPYWNKEFVQDFFTFMGMKVKNTNPNWVESGRWKSMCDMLVVLDKNHKPLAKDGAVLAADGISWIRADIAQMAIDATLDVLGSYTFLGGPQNIRLVSNIVSGERFKDMDEVPQTDAPQQNNFIIQAIGATNWYGVPAQKKLLVRTLEKLGKEEALILAQSRYMQPPQDVRDIVTQNKEIAAAMGEEIKTIFTEYTGALKAVTTGITPIFTEDENGVFQIKDLPDDSALKQLIKDHEKQIMSAAVRGTGYANLQKQAKEALNGLTMEKIRGMNGETLLRTIMQVAIAGSGGDDVLKNLITVFENLVANVNGTKNGNIVNPNAYGDDSFSLFIHKLQTDTGIASMLSTMNTQNERVGEIVSETMKSIAVLRTSLEEAAEVIAKSTGAEDTAKVAEEVTQMLLKQIIGVVEDETSRQRVVGMMKKSQIDLKKSEAAVWEAVELEIATKQTGHLTDGLGELYANAGKEVKELKDRRAQFYASRENIITSMNQSIEEASKSMVTVVKSANKIHMAQYPKYLAWLNTVLNRDEAPVDGKVNIQARLTAFAQYCNRHGLSGGVQQSAVKIAAQSVLLTRMTWTAPELLRIHGLVMDNHKIRALTPAELDAEELALEQAPKEEMAK